MITIQGKGVSSGIGMGPLYFFRRTKIEIKNYIVEDKEAEWLRFKGAQSIAVDQLGELAEKARAEAGDEAAMLFETHQMMTWTMRKPSRLSSRRTVTMPSGRFPMWQSSLQLCLKPWTMLICRVVLLM